MKALSYLLRLIGVIFALIAVLLFAIDFVPVDGFRFGEWKSSSGEHMYFKVVRAGESTNVALFAFLSAVVSVIFFILPSAISRSKNEECE